MKKLNSVSLAVSLLVTPVTQAAVYNLQELSGANASTAGAGFKKNATSAFFAPAAITELAGSEFSFNAGFVYTDAAFKDNGSMGLYENNNSEPVDLSSFSPTIAAFYTTPLNDEVSIGFALTPTSGSNLDYGEGFNGSELLTDVSVATVQFNPSVAFLLNDDISFSLGAAVEYGVLTQNMLSGSLENNMTSLAYGYVASIYTNPIDNLEVLLNYRSEITHEFEGEAELKGADLGVLDSKLDYIQPQNLTISSVYAFDDFDYLLTLAWHDFSVVQSTDVELTLVNIEIERRWSDVYTIASGFRFDVRSNLTFEGGVAFESSPQNDSNYTFLDVPTGDVYKIGAGMTYFSNDDIDYNIYYEFMYLDGSSTTVKDNLGTLSGSYDLSIHFVGVNINYG